MKTDQRTENVTRESILKLLSDDEVASVCTAETKVTLAEHDEYIDLEQIERGVQKAHGAAPAMGRMLPRKAVHPDTWTQILTAVKAFGSLSPQGGK